HILLGVERIPARSLEQLRLRVRLEQRTFAQRSDQLRRLLTRERRERDVRGVQLPSAPRLPALEQLQPRRAENQHRDVTHPVREVLDEVEQAVVGPLHVLKHEHERVLLRECLEEPPPRRERLLLRARRIERPPDEWTQMREHPLRVLLDQLLDRPLELGVDLLVAVGLEDPRLRLHHLRQRPVADTLAVRQRTPLAPERQLAAALDRLEELADETTLADSRDADQRDELWCRARSSVPMSDSTSRWRPTSGLCDSGARSTPKRARACTTSHTCTGSS